MKSFAAALVSWIVLAVCAALVTLSVAYGFKPSGWFTVMYAWIPVLLVGSTVLGSIRKGQR